LDTLAPEAALRFGSGRELREECGVFGVVGHPQAALLSYFGLFALQHRGQESAGIAVADSGEIVCLKDMGLVGEVFSRDEVVAWDGSAAIGHVRYPTYGSSNLSNAQPLVVRARQRQLALAHNGEITNATQLRAELEAKGAVFQTGSDSEVVAHLVAQSRHDRLEDALLEALRRVQGGYALVILSEDALYAVRDPHGIRPLSLGRLGDAWIVASESCAFDSIGACTVRDVKPGEMLRMGSTTSRRTGTADADADLQSFEVAPPGRPALCSFEYIYFARPDSDIQGRNVHMVRKQLGRKLARDYPVEADLVTGVPDSSVSAAIGYAEEAGLPNEIGLIKNRYVGRTFIQPTQEGREFAVRLKLNPLRQVIDGRRVVLVDDSIVRGTTSRYIVRLLRQAGAREVHLRITSPPYACPCFYGIDTSSSSELIASSKDVAAIREVVGADSLGYQTVQGLTDAIGLPADQLCLACFYGDYPVAVSGAPQIRRPLARKKSWAACARRPAHVAQQGSPGNKE
jgi:amidophosphoribosyltransferase